MIPDWEVNRVYFSHLLETEYPAVCRRLTEILTAHGFGVETILGTKAI